MDALEAIRKRRSVRSFTTAPSSAAIENMLFAATALGYGSCSVEGDALPREAQYKDLLDVPEGKRLMALIPIGVATDWPVREKKSLEQVIHWEKY